MTLMTERAVDCCVSGMSMDRNPGRLSGRSADSFRTRLRGAALAIAPPALHCAERSTPESMRDAG
jgi:hypothetical protein